MNKRDCETPMTSVNERLQRMPTTLQCVKRCQGIRLCLIMFSIHGAVIIRVYDKYVWKNAFLTTVSDSGLNTTYYFVISISGHAKIKSNSNKKKKKKKKIHSSRWCVQAFILKRLISRGHQS